MGTRIAVAIAVFILFSLYIVSGVGEKMCEEGPYLMTVGNAAQLILVATIVVGLGWFFGYGCGYDDK